MEGILGFFTALTLAFYACGIVYNPPEPTKVIIQTKVITVVDHHTVLVKPFVEEDKDDIIAKRAANKIELIKDISDKQEWYIEYKRVIEEYADYLVAPESIYDSYTDDEIRLMCRVIETEAHGLTFDKKCNVASVILNRIAHEKFGDTPTEVCTAPGQFVYSCKNITEETLLALEYAYQIEDTTGGAIYFHSNDYIPEKWNGATLLMTDGSHAFYG